MHFLLPFIASLAGTITESSASSLTPPVLPLAVRNPYLSLWLQEARNPPWSRWPIFWTGQDMGLGVLVKVAETGTVYPLLGRPHDPLLGDLDDKGPEEAGYEKQA